MWLIVRQLHLKAGCWDALLALWDLALSNLPRTQGLTYLLRGQDRNVWLMIKQLPLKAGCWDDPLALWDLAVSNLYDIIHGRQPILLLWRLPGRRVPTLATHTSDSALPVSPSPRDLLTKTTKELTPSHNSPPTRTDSTIPTHSPWLPPLGRHPAAASLPNLPSFVSRHTSIQLVKMASRTWQSEHNSSGHTPDLHSGNSRKHAQWETSEVPSVGSSNN